MLYLAPALALMALVFLFPLGFVVYNSFMAPDFTLNAYVALASSPMYGRVLLTTFEISIGASLISVLLGYPVALHLARQTPRRRALYIVLVLLPFWTSILVKSYAFTAILGEQGVINQVLRWTLGSQAGIPMLFNRTAVMIGMTHYLVPFVIFPVLASLLARDPDLYKAAQVMGAGPVRVFFRITLPLSLPGVLAGLLMTMALSVGFFVTPALLGGRRDMMMANLIDFYTRETLNWNLASAIAIVLLLLSGVLIGLLMRVRRDDALV